MPSTERTNRYWLVAIVAVAVFSLAYSVLILQRVLFGLVPIVLALLLYAGWRTLATE